MPDGAHDVWKNILDMTRELRQQFRLQQQQAAADDGAGAAPPTEALATAVATTGHVASTRASVTAASAATLVPAQPASLRRKLVSAAAAPFVPSAAVQPRPAAIACRCYCCCYCWRCCCCCWRCCCYCWRALCCWRCCGADAGTGAVTRAASRFVLFCSFHSVCTWAEVVCYQIDVSHVACVVSLRGITFDGMLLFAAKVVFWSLSFGLCDDFRPCHSSCACMLPAGVCGSILVSRSARAPMFRIYPVSSVRCLSDTVSVEFLEI